MERLIDGNLRDLRRINHWLGGVTLSAAAIDALAAHRAALTLLDVGPGGADIPAALARLARTRRRRLHAVGIDSRPEVLAAAARARPADADVDGIELREMGRVARLGVVVNDLDRTRVGWVGAWLIGHLFTTNRYTRHDVLMFVRRAYRPQEVAAMLFAAGLRPVRVVRGAFGQRYAIAAVPSREGGSLTAGEPPDPIGAGE